MNQKPDLRTLQRWFATVVEHIATADVAMRSPAARRLVPLRAVHQGAIIVPNPRMPVADQLQVYNGGYQQRLIEVLQGDYGGMHHVLGDERFVALMARYLRVHPSRHQNLNQLGNHVPAFVRRQRGLPERAFLADLAQLELAVCHSFDAPECSPATQQQLQQVPADAWGAIRFVMNPSLKLLASRFPVARWYLGWKTGKALAVPAAERAWTLVFRRDDQVWRQSLSKPAFLVLQALASGQSLARALLRAGEEPAVTAWFAEWARDGLFARIAAQNGKGRHRRRAGADESNARPAR